MSASQAGSLCYAAWLADERVIVQAALTLKDKHLSYQVVGGIGEVLGGKSGLIYDRKPQVSAFDNMTFNQLHNRFRMESPSFWPILVISEAKL